MNHPFKEPEEDALSCLLVVCVCLNFLVWPWVWVFNMSGFLLPLGKAGAFVNYSLNWQVDWICANGWWNAFEIFFFPLCCRWVGAPLEKKTVTDLSPHSCSSEEACSRKRTHFSSWSNHYWSCSSEERNEKQPREQAFLQEHPVFCY